MFKSRAQAVPLDEQQAATGAVNSTQPSCIWSFLGYWNTLCIPILFGLIVLLFIQIQYLTHMIHEEQEQIDDLLLQVKNQQQGQQTLVLQVEHEHSLTLYQMAGTFTLLVALITIFHITTHLRHYNEPIVQRKVIAILWMCPIYCLTSFLSLLFPVADGYLAVIKDFYEAYTIYNFLAFLIAVLGRGDRNVVVQVLARQQEEHGDQHTLPPPARCLRRFYHPPPESSNEAAANAVLTECQILCLQFVLIRPLTSIAGFVSSTLLQHDDADADGDRNPWSYFLSPGFYIAMITNVSVYFAFSGLLKFYHLVRDELSWLQPFSKFMSIKGIVFLTFWQGLAISIIVNLQDSNNDSYQVSSGMNATSSDMSSSTNNYNHHSTTSSKSPQEQAAEIQNILICLEMLFFSIAHWCVFPVEEWEEGYRPRQYAKPGIGFQDFVSDMSYIVSSSRERRKHGQQVKQQQQQKQLLHEEECSSVSSGLDLEELERSSNGVHPPPPPHTDLLVSRVESSPTSPTCLSHRSPRSWMTKTTQQIT